MRCLALPIVLSVFISCNAVAAPVDIVGGPVGATQTMHHCGYLPVSGELYTTSSVTTSLIERKLAGLGYNTVISGRYSKNDALAVKQFQRDYGLKADGVVGPETAQRLAFVTHPSAHVRSCQRMARGY